MAVFEFGPFRLDIGERTLWRDGAPVALQPRVFDTLVVLVRRAGQLVRKAELLRELWPDTHVSEANLTQNVWSGPGASTAAPWRSRRRSATAAPPPSRWAAWPTSPSSGAT